jgi:hypothetical protein
MFDIHRYDFAVFGYFGDIIGDVFFPPQAGHAAIVESFAVFGAAVSCAGTQKNCFDDGMFNI